MFSYTQNMGIEYNFLKSKSPEQNIVQEYCGHPLFQLFGQMQDIIILFKTFELKSQIEWENKSHWICVWNE